MGKSMRKAAVLGGFAAGMALRICCAAYGAGGTDPGKAACAFGQLWEKVKACEAAVTGEDPQGIPDSRFLAGDRTENDTRLISAAGQCMTGDGADRAFYVVGRNYMPEGSVLPAVFGQRLEYSCTPEETVSWQGDTYYAVRFAVREVSGGTAGGADAGLSGSGGADGGLGAPGIEGAGPGISGGVDGGVLWADGAIPALHHWNVGDVVARTLDGVSYRFRCIDRNYEEEGVGRQQSLALFLCESVIPANTGSEYVYERLEDGSSGYVYHPGPVVNFGESSEYAESPVRSWLGAQEADADVFPEADVGVEYGCTGRTDPGSFGRFDRSDLRFCRLGSQILTDRYFILSVEEALKYREYLWNVDGCGEEETAANAGPFSSGYWLRTPMGDGSGGDTGCVYVVDLVNGNIHPQAVRPDAGETDDRELAVTTPIGVRPAFVLRQRD